MPLMQPSGLSRNFSCVFIYVTFLIDTLEVNIETRNLFALGTGTEGSGF